MSVWDNFCFLFVLDAAEIQNWNMLHVLYDCVYYLLQSLKRWISAAQGNVSRLILESNTIFHRFSSQAFHISYHTHTHTHTHKDTGRAYPVNISRVPSSQTVKAVRGIIQPHVSLRSVDLLRIHPASPQVSWQPSICPVRPWYTAHAQILWPERPRFVSTAACRQRFQWS